VDGVITALPKSMKVFRASSVKNQRNTSLTEKLRSPSAVLPTSFPDLLFYLFSRPYLHQLKGAVNVVSAGTDSVSAVLR
jgi:hypothetical protein